MQLLLVWKRVPILKALVQLPLDYMRVKNFKEIVPLPLEIMRVTILKALIQLLLELMLVSQIKALQVQMGQVIQANSFLTIFFLRVVLSHLVPSRDKLCKRQEALQLGIRRVKQVKGLYLLQLIIMVIF